MVLLVLFSALLAHSKDVMTQFGIVHGVSHPNLETYFGIPFAQPPIGSLRFMPPVQWTSKYPSGVWNATDYGKSCDIFTNQAGTASEDCLYLNIYAPVNITTLLPVMIFIHGGGFLGGRSNDVNGSVLAEEQNVVVVSANYRLASLGFLPFTDLLQQKITTGNQGLLDQRAAFVWVQDNIALFGGDPKQVTIFGDSAGAVSCMTHTIMPKSFPYFHKVISESGLMFTNPVNWVIESWTKMLTRVNCKQGAGALKCMQAKSTLEIIWAQNGGESVFTGLGWTPVVDGIEITDDPNVLLEKGPRSPAPLLVGTVSDEGTTFVFDPNDPNPMNVSAYKAYVLSLMKNTTVRTVPESFVQQVFAMYPPVEGDNRAIASRVLGDKAFVCGSRNFIRTSNITNRYLYEFAHKPCQIVPAYYGVYHSSDVYFVFHLGCPFWLPPLNNFAKEIGLMWSTFARTSNPSPQWPKYTNKEDQNIVLTAPLRVETGLRKQYCDLWDKYRFDRYH